MLHRNGFQRLCGVQMEQSRQTVQNISANLVISPLIRLLGQQIQIAQRPVQLLRGLLRKTFQSPDNVPIMLEHHLGIVIHIAARLLFRLWGHVPCSMLTRAGFHQMFHIQCFLYQLAGRFEARPASLFSLRLWLECNYRGSPYKSSCNDHREKIRARIIMIRKCNTAFDSSK